MATGDLAHSRTPMMHLQDHALSFTFPEIAQEVRAHFERQLQIILPELQRPEERARLVAELESRWGFRQLSRTEQDRLRARANSLTAAEIEAAVRQTARYAVGSDGDPLAELTIEFQQTLRIPDDGTTYPLPAGLGAFPLHSVDDFAGTAPASWLKKGGVMMPMYQSEALWIRFSARTPFAVKIAAGKINAVSGEAWTAELQSEPQNYLVVPEQPWLDGFSVGAGLIRQFVAMPLGAGYSVEEQLTGQAEFAPSPRSSASTRKNGVAKSSTWQRGSCPIPKESCAARELNCLWRDIKLAKAHCSSRWSAPSEFASSCIFLR